MAEFWQGHSYLKQSIVEPSEHQEMPSWRSPNTHFLNQHDMSRHKSLICHSSSSGSYAIVFVAAVTYSPSVGASLRGGSVSLIVGCSPRKSSLFPTAMTVGACCAWCIGRRLPLTSVRSTTFQPCLEGSSDKNTCWQCNGNANESECMWLKFATMKPYRSRSILGNHESRVGLTHSHNNTVVPWFW